MAQLDRLILDFQNLINNLDSEIDKAVIKDSKAILERIKGRLWGTGLDADGNLIGNYAPQTIEKKKKKGQVFNHITLLDTSAFYDGMYVESKGAEITIYSSDSKTLKLINDFGQSILGLTQVEQEIIVNFTIEKHIQSLLDKIQDITIEI